MTNEKTDNELIAEFMGMKYRKGYGPLTGETYDEVKQTPNANWQIAYFHKSWDWLIPACNKAFQICMTDKRVQEAFRHDDSALVRFCMKSMFAKSDITGLMEINPVYLKLLDFIKFYNSLTPSPENI